METLYELPLCDTHGLFFDALGHLADKPNTLANSKSQPDETAIISVLQFGAIIPPLTPWRGIQRFKPGYRYCGTHLVGPQALALPTDIARLDLEQQSDEVERLVDRMLKDLIGHQPDPVLLFSGGVDSGLIASRLAALGYRDSLLLNYSFGEDDPESQLAEAMAKHLGLRFERISSNSNLCECLIDPGHVYPYPFGDHATVPTSDLARAVVNRLAGQHHIILDGTGADGGFGMVKRIDEWSRVARIPSPIRQVASLAYDAALWNRKGMLEYLCRVLRRSINLPPLSAAIAQNCLAGCLYHALPQNELNNLIADWVGGCVDELLLHLIVVSDMALLCANKMAQKSQPILERAGHQVCYPFLQTEVVSMALAAINHWQLKEAKAPLKRSLARYVPRNMVYRPKSGFIDPEGRVFFDASFIAYLRAAADSTSPIASCLHSPRLIKACDMLSRKTRLPPQTLKCLWAITFLDRWYRTAR